MTGREWGLMGVLALLFIGAMLAIDGRLLGARRVAVVPPASRAA